MVDMRSTTQLSALAALVFSLTLVASKPLHQFKPRLQTDACADLDDELVISGTVLGKVSICACASVATSLLSSGNSVINKAVAQFGAQTVTESLQELILNSDNYENCQYADNSEPVCEIGNPCGFKCTNGYTAYPSTGKATSCICASPYNVCNGQCGEYSSCYSGIPSYSYSKRALSECDPGWKLCQIPSRGIKECVDVMNDLWSCGGCEIPSFEDEAIGVDCTAIPNVGGVSCLEGVCQVESCGKGFQINNDQTGCAPKNNSTLSHNSLFVQNSF